MANKALATRQKMRLRVEPSSQLGKPRNPFAALAKGRVAGAHAKPLSSERQAAKRALKKARLEPEDE
jgi:TRAP-type C4-dicarboxylate transport system substrate-binding protein